MELIKAPFLPKVLLHIILQYDGRIKYKYKKGDYENGIYVNIIITNDYRYDIIRPIIIRKKKNIQVVYIDKNNYYFQFNISDCLCIGLRYTYIDGLLTEQYYYWQRVAHSRYRNTFHIGWKSILIYSDNNFVL